MGCSPWGLEESDRTEQLDFHFSLSCIGEGNGNPRQCSCLENPKDREAWWAAVYAVAQSQTWLKWLSSSNTLAKKKKKGQNQIIPKWKIHFTYIWEPQLKAPSRIWLLHSKAQDPELTLEIPATSPFLMSGRESGSPPHPQLHAACQPNKEFGFQWRGSSRLCSNISECLQTHWK